MAREALTPQQALSRALSAYKGRDLIEAEKICLQIVDATRDYFDALHLLALVQAALGKNDLALASYDRACSIRPDDAVALNNRGLTLQGLKRLDEALASYDRALSLRPDYAKALCNRGNVLQELGRFGEALASYDRAGAAQPDFAEAFNNRGVALKELKRHEEALTSYDNAIALRPDYAEALNNRGVVLKELNRHSEALANYDHALALRPDYAKALVNRAIALHEMKRFKEALAGYDRAITARTDNTHAFSGAAECALEICDWNRRTEFAAALPDHVLRKNSIVSPFVLLGYSDDPLLQLQCARKYVDSKIPAAPRPLWSGERWRHDKLRVAYLSADFSLTRRGVSDFERHDRSRFEIIGISYGVDDSSAPGQRLIASFDRFYDVRQKSDEEAARLLHDFQIDIAIDRQGHTRDSRPGILAHRPAPIQVNYLAYPGTMGASFIDYIIADRVIAPFEHQQFYAERIVHLPDCYQVNDTSRRIAETTPTRSQMGLPEHGFVFCCFNNNWKFTPAIFGTWMRLLHQVEGGVLWLLRTNDSATRNLRDSARQHGIDPSRLVFANRLPLHDHLARHRLADLFLDTLPYNAHTTTSDALWVGSPVLTCLGGAFAARVAASMLDAVRLPELVASDLREYEAMALRLARDPTLLAGIKTKLAGNHNAHPLFDTDRFARHLEAAYITMWETWQRGEAPKSFAVAPIGVEA